MSTTVIGSPGVIITADDVDQELLVLLKNWMPTYLRIIKDERGLAKMLAVPDGASYRSVLQGDEFMDTNLPGVLVTTSKTAGNPIRRPSGVYEATWTSVVSAVVRGTVPLETRARANYYESAVRRTLGIRRNLAGSLIHSTIWRAMEITPVADVSREGRYLCASMTTFDVTTHSAFDDSGGFDGPFVDPVHPPNVVQDATIADVTFDFQSEPIPEAP